MDCTRMALYYLYVDLYENGAQTSITDFTADERDVICMEIEELWMDTYLFRPHTREFIAALNQDEDDLFLYATENGLRSALPSDCRNREVTIGAPKINEQTLKLVGDRIPIRVPGRRLEVMFSDI